MNRNEFYLKFGNEKQIVLPVIHVLNHEQTYNNIIIAIACGCPGVFLINHDFEKEKLISIIKSIRVEFPDYWIGENFIAVTGEFAFPILGKMQSEGIFVDGYWADDACIDERRAENDQLIAKKINIIRKESGWQGIYIGGTAFKKQREVDPSMYGYSARLATNHMDVIVTSGIATGHAVDLKKINIFRQNCGETTMAVASGISPENVNKYIKNVDLFMVATGINFNNDFYNIDPNKLNKLMNVIESDGENYEHR